MATDATGAPTPLGIPKFNTSADAPSGLGGNAQMDAIDALIAARVASPAGIASSDVPVWNGTAWVRSSSSSVRINNGGTALPQITSSALSGGPPASPSDGDIWIATGVDANGTVWQFRYNAGSGSPYKWEFIGGSPFYSAVDTLETTTSVYPTLVDLTTVGPGYVVSRAGDYAWAFAARVRNNTNNGGAVVGIVANGTADAAPGVVTDATVSSDNMVGEKGVSTGIPASATIKLQYAVLAGTGTFFQRRMFVWPRRIS